MGTIKDRNGMGLTETEDIKKRCQEYTEELSKKKKKKIFTNQIITMMLSLTRARYPGKQSQVVLR